MFLLSILVACGSSKPASPDAAPPVPPPPDPYSNIEPSDYVGPDACGDCHTENHDKWSRTLHAKMNTIAAPDTVRGDFDNVAVAYQGGLARFARDGDAFTMTLTPPRGVPTTYRVTRTIGSKYLQEYVGVAGGAELRLPWGYWMRERRWVPSAFFDSWEDGSFDAFDPDPAPWAGRCAWCHNTYPYAYRVARDVGRGFADWFVSDQPAPETVTAFVTVGISCESCHLGGREHAENDRPIRFVPSSPHLTLRPGAPDLSGGRTNPVVVDAICAQCHSTPAPRYPDGAAVRNSSEALDLAASPCAPAIACTDCHDPHEGGVDEKRALAACSRCHPNEDHGHHASVTCLDCHMPRIVEGVSSFVRTHRISSPTDPAMLAFGAPNACNLCHLDRSLGWTADAIERDWGRRLDVPGDTFTAAGALWLASPSKSVRITAAAAYARAPRLGRAALPAIIAVIDDPIPFFRIWMLFAVEDLVGRRLTRDEYDPLGDEKTRAAQARRLLHFRP